MDGGWAIPGICHKLHTEDSGLHSEVVGYHQTFFVCVVVNLYPSFSPLLPKRSFTQAPF